MQRIVLDIAIASYSLLMLEHYYMPALCYYAAMKISVHECFIIYTITDSYTQLILNALLGCIKFLSI